MSKETAPNYKRSPCCFYCGHCMLEREKAPYCSKHDFFFDTDEARFRVCDDYGHWQAEEVKDD